jgi:histidine ammonia-lyase
MITLFVKIYIMSYNYLPLDRKRTNFKQIKNLLAYNQQVSITFDAHERILACRQYLDEKLKTEEEIFYGINTGFGFLQNVSIDKTQLNELQANLIKSHACGIGEEVPIDIVKLMIAFKIKSLSYGHSGVQIDTVKRLMDMYNAEMYPIVYTQGSLGASGDLAPLSHLSLPLIGLGEVYLKEEKMSSEKALAKLNWQPLVLQSKEGLALINGTQFMSAYGLHNLIQAEKLVRFANIIAAISFDAFDCKADSLNPHLHKIRPHAGQKNTASTLSDFLTGSEILKQQKKQVQDPYSFRCIAQVHGATTDTIEFVKNTFIQEINAVTDNPNIFPDEDLVLSGGNFHGQPLALGADFLAIAMSEIGNISERRTYQLISGQRDLPPFLSKDSGLHSGLMIPQYTAAGIVSENKQLCTPSSVDSIPSSNNQEDHVSMGANAAVKCKRVLDNVEKILAIELLTACQAIDFKRPLQTSHFLENVIKDFRAIVSFNDKDRILHNDILAAIHFIQKSNY